jgi:hypothetical protein
LLLEVLELAIKNKMNAALLHVMLGQHAGRPPDFLLQAKHFWVLLGLVDVVDVLLGAGNLCGFFIIVGFKYVKE